MLYPRTGVPNTQLTGEQKMAKFASKIADLFREFDWDYNWDRYMSMFGIAARTANLTSTEIEGMTEKESESIIAGFIKFFRGKKEKGNKKI